MKLKQRWVGLDVHKDTITIATAEGSRKGELRVDGQVRLAIAEERRARSGSSEQREGLASNSKNWRVPRAQTELLEIHSFGHESRHAILGLSPTSAVSPEVVCGALERLLHDLLATGSSKTLARSSCPASRNSAE